MRIFIAFPLEIEEARELYVERQALRDSLPRLRWIPPENFHITLQFMGELTAKEAEEVSFLLEDLATSWKSHILETTGPGQFPGSGKPKLIFEGLKDGQQILGGYYRELLNHLVELSFPLEQRKYRPHISLCRVPRSAPEILPPKDNPAIKLAPLRLHIDHVALYRSHLHPSGAEYQVLSMIPLGE